MKITILLPALAMALCSATAINTTCFAQKEVFTDAASIAGTWKLVPVLASDTASGKLAVLQFNVADKSFTGNTGCNAINGKINLNGSMLSIKEQSVDTKNDCQGYNEEAFVSNLLKVNHYKIENGILMLMVDQTILSKWVKKEATATKTI